MIIEEAIRTVPVTIASGQSLSDSVSLGRLSAIQPTSGKIFDSDLRLFGISIPSVWTTADITFLSSRDNGVTYQNILDADGNEITIQAVADSEHGLLPDALASVTHIKLRSGTSSAPVNQAADRTITLILRSY